jgi:hypothetical protein
MSTTLTIMQALETRLTIAPGDLFSNAAMLPDTFQPMLRKVTLHPTIDPGPRKFCGQLLHDLPGAAIHARHFVPFVSKHRHLSRWLFRKLLRI